ncbi:PP2C family protein-serine/threonine phosphatase [Arcticibacter sp. MXS-1]|uniref:PP2C family protein-serine/threonine phosphatase n=1 Tax=Arcticibacter sp. MXS-1 TaxID=3341726 RepID=UPI0035A94BE2
MELDKDKTDIGPSENDLIQLLLKRQSELNALLEVTLAINKNSAASVLYAMLEVILRVNLKVGRMSLLIREGSQFTCAAGFGAREETPEDFQKICEILLPYKTITALSGHSEELLNKYDFFVPVRHKNSTLAFVLIGDFNTKPEVLSHELNYIQTLINIIVVALENKKLFWERVQRERFQREIELAGEVQNMLVPLRLPKSANFEIAATYLPHQNIGGDYFDFIRLNDKEFIWCIGDVSGKGMPAALLMATVQASLRAWTYVENDLEKLVRRLNEVVTHNTKGERFITLFLGKYNEETREMEYINAGHNSPILIADCQSTFLKEGTTLLGPFDELPFVRPGKLILPPAALIFNYTDGLIESDDEDVFISEEELVEYLTTHCASHSSQINKGILTEIQTKNNAKMHSDDITLFTLKIY